MKDKARMCLASDEGPSGFIRKQAGNLQRISGSSCCNKTFLDKSGSVDVVAREGLASLILGHVTIRAPRSARLKWILRVLC